MPPAMLGMYAGSERRAKGHGVMKHGQQRWQRLAVAGAVGLAVAAGAAYATRGARSPAVRSVVATGQVLEAMSLAPGIGGFLHRFTTRAVNSGGRLVSLLGEVGVLWLWFGVSLGSFLLVTAVSSVVDVRMWSLRRQGPRALARYLGHGMRLFFRILRDRRTPYRARGILVVALLYWLLPVDFINDTPVLPGLLDDLVVAVLAAKVFVYLCPDALLAAHAAAVEAQA
jgi:uncharacterized membrane protein YkvA (DUF1232 family)